MRAASHNAFATRDGDEKPCARPRNRSGCCTSDKNKSSPAGDTKIGTPNHFGTVWSRGSRSLSPQNVKSGDARPGSITQRPPEKHSVTSSCESVAQNPSRLERPTNPLAAKPCRSAESVNTPCISNAKELDSKPSDSETISMPPRLHFGPSFAQQPHSSARSTSAGQKVDLGGPKVVS